MSELREALAKAAVVNIPGQSTADRIDNAVHFLRSLEESGWKLQAPAATSRQISAGLDWLPVDLPDDWPATTIATIHKALWDSAPTIAELLEEKTRG